MKRKLKVILVMVTSVNGNSTKGKDSPHVWATSEDQQFFSSILKDNNLFVMGRSTYESAKKGIKLQEGKKRIVLTNTPAKFKKEEVSGQLEFTNKTVNALVKESEDHGYKTMILLGGSIINSLFFKENLVDELWLTLEPLLFNGERGLVKDIVKSVSLQLRSVKKLNKNGTLLLKYFVKN